MDTSVLDFQKFQAWMDDLISPGLKNGLEGVKLLSGLESLDIIPGRNFQLFFYLQLRVDDTALLARQNNDRSVASLTQPLIIARNSLEAVDEIYHNNRNQPDIIETDKIRLIRGLQDVLVLEDYYAGARNTLSRLRGAAVPAISEHFEKNATWVRRHHSLAECDSALLILTYLKNELAKICPALLPPTPEGPEPSK